MCYIGTVNNSNSHWIIQINSKQCLTLNQHGNKGILLQSTGSFNLLANLLFKKGLVRN